MTRMTRAKLNGWKHVIRLSLAAGLALGVISCTVDKTQSAKAPDVDVEVDPGRWPKYNVKWADVDVGTRTKTVTVPKLEWKREQTEIQVPYIDINAAGANREERTISVEAEVPHSGYNLKVREVRAAGDQLWVISELTQTGKGKPAYGRVSDQVVVNAPEDLQVRRVIVGGRPEGVYNQQYTFYPDMNALTRALPQGGGRVLYSAAA